MSNFNGKNFTTFQNVNLRGTGGESGALRNDAEDGYVVSLPKKAGVFPISGTFAVNLPSMSAATQIYTTVSTVAGIRAEDGISVTLMASFDNTARILVAATAGNGQITTQWYNLGVAVNADDYTIAFTAVR